MSGIQIVHDVLAASAAVTALADDRISPVDHKDTYPAVVLTSITETPVNALDGWCGLDYSIVQMDAQAQTYASADQLAQACRTALQNAGHLALPSPSDTIEPFINLDGIYQVSKQFGVWSS
jgi:hypothetical protein